MKKISNYTLYEKFYLGKLGALYKAYEHSDMTKKVVIKIISPNDGSTGTLKYSSFEWFDNLREIEHENILNIKKVIEVNRKTILVLPYFEGVTLDTISYMQGGTISLEIAMKIFFQVINGVEYLHHKGLIHGNLSPDSIIIDANLNVKIIDSNLSELLTSSKKNKTILCDETNYFQSPEFFNGINLDCQTDIYSIGMLMYKCLTGQHPFVFKDISYEALIINRIKNGYIPHPILLNPLIHKLVGNIILRCLEKQRKDRILKIYYLRDLLKLALNDIDPFEFDLMDNMVFVEGGEYLMGSNDNRDQEKPVHKVKVNNFLIGKYPVTIEEYQEFCKATGRRIRDALGVRFPIYAISWIDAHAYADWVGGRLPTEAEWEFAARGGKQSRGYRYSGSYMIDNVAWNNAECTNTLNTVGTKFPNELGLFDMSGNVWEWCSDWYQKNYYCKSPFENPKGPPKGISRSMRGGNYGYFGDTGCRVTCREGNLPDSHSGGMRIVYDIEIDTIISNPMSLPSNKDTNFFNVRNCDKEDIYPRSNILAFNGDNNNFNLHPVETKSGRRKNGNPKYIYENLVFVRGGKFYFGKNDKLMTKGQLVKIRSFFISKFPVTVKEYFDFCKEVGRVLPEKPSFGWVNNAPIINLTQEDVLAYCKWAGVRLPTEAEWEFAARGGNKSQGYKYSGSNNLEDVAWIYENSDHKTHPVGEKLPNELGIYDMNGNVMEFCTGYKGPFSDYKFATNINLKENSYISYVLKGNSWRSESYSYSLTERSWPVETEHFHSYHYSIVGFRVATDC